jgi:hypothetical protein
MTIRPCLYAVATALLALMQAPSAAAGQGASAVRFANSCAPSVQAEFGRAITLLHSFEYGETRRLFVALLADDPTCAMARWGIAMTLWHPLWAPPSSAELEEGARVLGVAAGEPMTAREAEYVEALQSYFSSTDPETHAHRVRAYETWMSELYENYPDDSEAAMFYALALLAAADPRDKTYARQYKAAALLNWVRESQPRHPGVLHYLIHAYDYPDLAHLALAPATIYADAAPDSAHAQHMPSHIFTRLGLWDRSIASNHDSTHSAAEYTKRAHLTGLYDEGLHSMDYLMYALLQTARDEEARALLEQLSDIDETDVENFKVAYTYAASPARYALERHAWREGADLERLRADFPWDEFGWAQSIHHFARGVGAARSGQLDRAAQEVVAIEDLQRRLPATTLPYWREQVSVQVDVVSSWILYGHGRIDEGLNRAAVAADREDAVDKHPVTPGEVLPARELYADMLFEAQRYPEALQQYRIVLRHVPNRLNALLGAAQAAAALGNRDLAARYRATVREQTRHGSGERAPFAD